VLLALEDAATPARGAKGQVHFVGFDASKSWSRR